MIKRCAFYGQNTSTSSEESYGESTGLRFGPDVDKIWKTQRQRDKEKEAHEWYKKWMMQMPSGVDHLGRINLFQLFDLTRRGLPPDVRTISGETAGQLRCFLCHCYDFKYDNHTDLIGLRFFKELMNKGGSKLNTQSASASVHNHEIITHTVYKPHIDSQRRNFQAANTGLVDKTDASTQTDKREEIQIVRELMCIDKVYQWLANSCPHLMQSFNELVSLYAGGDEANENTNIWDPQLRPVTLRPTDKKRPVKDKACNCDESILEIEIIIGRTIQSDAGLIRFIWSRSRQLYERLITNPLLQE